MMRKAFAGVDNIKLSSFLLSILFIARGSMQELENIAFRHDTK
jgi:hypothetical protein